MMKVRLECGLMRSLRSKAAGTTEYTAPESTRKLSFKRLPRFCRVSNVHFDVSQAHKQPRDSSVVSAKKRVKRKAPVRCQRGSPFFLTKE